MASKENLSREELLKKLKNEFEESETLQWFIEVEIKRLTSKEEVSYEELKRLAKLSEERISETDKKNR
ncbi:hypothetical protein [Aquimarina celericrescens]|uniref:Uncharacterized protein n=1 Tax=Aquimarina celericrescens TaxID=1964542 RepID=A0ABW5AYA9_9FLAO|nr:hypothetical protein [Aquimarina celericrescens]